MDHSSGCSGHCSRDHRLWGIFDSYGQLFVVIFYNGITNILVANAPRWLISKRRKEDAIRTLEKVRPKEDVGTFSSLGTPRMISYERG